MAKSDEPAWAGMPEHQKIGPVRDPEPEPEPAERDGLLTARNYIERLEGADPENLVRLQNFAPVILQKITKALEASNE